MLRTPRRTPFCPESATSSRRRDGRAAALNARGQGSGAQPVVDEGADEAPSVRREGRDGARPSSARSRPAPAAHQQVPMKRRPPLVAAHPSRGLLLSSPLLSSPLFSPPLPSVTLLE